MIRLSALLGQKAIALGTATETGSVKGIAIEHDQIIGVELSETVIPASAVRSFEGDVLTYDEHQGAFEGTVAPSDPRGMRVLDMAGDGHGTIADLEIDSSGTIESVLLDSGDSVAGSRLRAIGSFAAILADEELPPPVGAPKVGP